MTLLSVIMIVQRLRGHSVRPRVRAVHGKTPTPSKRASVVTSSNAPRTFDIPAASLRVLAVVQTEWKACPTLHRELLLTVCLKGFLHFAKTHNANMIDVPKPKVVGAHR